MQEPPGNMTHPNASLNQNSAHASVDDLVRTFNTALVATQAGQTRDFSGELYALVDSAAFRAILNGIRQLARLQGITDREAAENVISTFRKVDRLWTDYIFQEGMDRVKSSGPSAN